jgi:hypothetical protein
MSLDSVVKRLQKSASPRKRTSKAAGPLNFYETNVARRKKTPKRSAYSQSSAELRKRTKNVPRDETYEGWKNQETWNVNLFFANDYPAYQALLAYKRAFGKFTAKIAKGYVLRLFPRGLGRGNTTKTGYRKVDWGEIAAGFNEMGT